MNTLWIPLVNRPVIFPEVLNLDRLFLNLNRFICNLAVGSPCSLALCALFSSYGFFMGVATPATSKTFCVMFHVESVGMSKWAIKASPACKSLKM